MIYHPEGVIRPTPGAAENETAYVYDYFIKDYLGNVRAVVTEEDAVLDDKWLATMEEAHAHIELQSFDNIPPTQYHLPAGYPVDASVEFNERIARLSAAEGTEVGPSLVIPVRRGEEVSLSTRYFYTEACPERSRRDAPGTTYETMGLLVDEVLMALATSGANVLPLNEGQLLGIANGSSQYADGVYDLLSNSFDTTNVDKPHAYLVWMFYDERMNLIPEHSGVARTEYPNELGLILQDAIPVNQDGYLHAYLTNGSAKRLNFDNFLVGKLKGNLRQINDYYPYGLSINGINADRNDYLNKYTSKELQTGEFDPDLSTGLEMFDFGSRFYDPQLGRWFTPDPAEQFHNPYLAMGNNPVMYVDPDGEFIFLAPIAAAVLLPTFTITAAATITAATIVAASVAVAATATAVALTVSSAASVTSVAPAAITPPDGYLYDPSKPNQLQWQNTNGRAEGLDYITNTQTGETVTRPMHTNFAMKNPTAELGNQFGSLADPMRITYPLNNMASLPAGPIGTSTVTPGLQGGVAALEPTPAAAASTSSGWGAASGFAGTFGSGAGLIAHDYSQGWRRYSFGDNFWYGGQHGVYRGVPLNQVPSQLRTAGILKGLGHGLGAASFSMTAYDYRAGNINGFQFGLETASSAYSTFGGVYGNAFGLGWELGRAVTSVPGYHEYFRVPMQRMLNLRP